MIVREIKAAKTTESKRICAYIRVSTDNKAQLDSLQNQYTYYDTMLRNLPGYTLTRVYSDKGISGYKADRPAFQEMLNDARAGAFDTVITKSVSRFARNTLVLLESIRELKSLNIDVWFEEANLHTLGATGELLITVLASVAEEERRNVSENIKWSIRKRYAQGQVNHNADHVFGYQKGKRGEWLIDEKQASVVRRVFSDYLSGKSIHAIAKELTSEHVPNEGGVSRTWNDSRISYMLSNEAYIGDRLLQKEYSLHGKSRTNQGILPQYYVDDHHPAIISRDVFDTAQKIKAARAKRSYPMSSMLRCPHCGNTLIRVRSRDKTGDMIYVGWQCITHLRDGKAVCPGLYVPDRMLEGLSFHEPMLVEKSDITDKGGDAPDGQEGEIIRYWKHRWHTLRYCFTPYHAAGQQ